MFEVDWIPFNFACIGLKVIQIAHTIHLLTNKDLQHPKKSFRQALCDPFCIGFLPMLVQIHAFWVLFLVQENKTGVIQRLS